MTGLVDKDEDKDEDVNEDKDEDNDEDERRVWFQSVVRRATYQMTALGRPIHLLSFRLTKDFSFNVIIIIINIDINIIIVIIINIKL